MFALFLLLFVTSLLLFCIFALGNNSKYQKSMGKKSEPSTKAKQPVRIRTKKLANGNKSVYLDIYVNGHREYEFLKMYLIPEKDSQSKAENKRTLELVEAIKAKRIIEINTATHGLSNRRERSKVLLRDYINAIAQRKGGASNRNYSGLIYHLERYSKTGIQIGQIDKYYILGFIEYLGNAIIEHTERNKGKTLSKSTQHHYYKFLKLVLDEAVSDDMIEANPMLAIKKSDRPKPSKPTERVFLTKEELNRFCVTDFGSKPSYDLAKRAFIFECLTGLRHCDIRKLKWGDIIKDYKGREYLNITQQKTGGAVAVYLNNNIREWLPQRGDHKPSDLIFEGLLSKGYINEYLLPKWAKMAGIDKHITTHVGRHTFATLGYSLSNDLYTVSKLLGHQDIETTQIYAKVLEDKKFDVMQAFDDIILKSEEK